MSAVRLKYLWLSVAICLVASPVARAWVDEPIEITMVKEPDGSHSILAWFMIETSTSTAWSTLSDYEGLGRFVPTIRKSKRVKEESGRIFIEQSMTGQAGFFKKNISLLLEITETKPTRIEFKDVSQKSFRLYSGSWQISNYDNGLAVTYKLNALPKFFAPDFIASGVFKRDIKDLLERVKTEMARRGQPA